MTAMILLSVAAYCILRHWLLSGKAFKEDTRVPIRISREDRAQDREAEKAARAAEKAETETEKQSYTIERCEDLIYHTLAVLDALNAQRDATLEELESVTERLEAHENGLDPLDASQDDRFRGEQGATLYMDLFSRTLSGEKKAKPADVDKLRKRKALLESKLVSLDGKIFTAQQKIKKAKFDRRAAALKLNRAQAFLEEQNPFCVKPNKPP